MCGGGGGRRSYIHGRWSSAHTALRIALSAPTDHFTEVLLHDYHRPGERQIADAVFGGTKVPTYVGDIAPDIGLGRWRIQGCNQPQLAMNEQSAV